MNMISLNCPNCNGELEVEDGLDTFFCKYCGSKIVLSGQSDAAYRAKTFIKEMEHNERMADRKYQHDEHMADKKHQHEKYKIEQKKKQERSKILMGILIPLACVIGYFVLIFGYFGTEEKKSIEQERELQQLVEEIMVDVDKKDFDSAYVKAQSIDYTENLNNDIDKKWDNTRREVINQIIEAEKKATGKSTHKPEKEGFFEKLFD